MINEFIVFLVLCLVLELLYFQIARRLNIVDRPGKRSSHDYITFRGGGIIFPLAFIMAYLFLWGKPHPILVIGLLAIAMISFVDDISSISSKLRLIIQSVAVVLLIVASETAYPWYIVLLIFIVITGTINIYNFMDGINGITALYSLVTIGSFFWVNQYSRSLMPPVFFEALIAALLVFSFFNMRKRAVSFAGDVGSISMAFLISYLLLRLVAVTGSIWWVAFLSIYGIDALFTICCRISRKESLMKAHRSHFYQYLANETKWTHLQVSAVYAGTQLLINIITINALLNGAEWQIFTVLLVIILIYLTFRLRLEGADRLFRVY